MTLKRITFTGADDQTNINELAVISHRHPYVEWGVLLPAKGKPRFPSVKWLREFVGMSVWLGVQIAGHLCPPWTGEFLHWEKTIRELVGGSFNRIQINTHGNSYTPRPAPIAAMVSDWRREYILQADGVNNTWQESVMRQANSRWHNISPLFDLSHGAGVLPDSWPPASDSWVGYSGGLGPHNLAEELPKILEAAAGDDGTDFWIDMETHVRTDGRFDLAKVLQCIEIAEPYVGRAGD